ncbi:MAG: hypothetical protein EXR58_06315, partial [Chloroflexi bacterium]|nr:hypothetical protein [Chloroflexota bacterium]
MIDAPPRRFAAVVIGATLLLLACGPSIAPTAGGKAASNAPSGPKTLTMYTRAEPNPLVLFGGRAGTSTSYYERFFMFHGNLTEFDSVGNVRPRLAAKVPTIQDGDWKVNSDGGMEVTWKIRPDVFWHDGKPLIAADFAFGFEVNRDPLLAVASMAEADKISAVKAVDAKTLVVSWNAISVLGNSNAVEGIPSIAKHLMEEPYRTLDPQAFSALPGWTGEYIGLGPYKVSGYEPGTFLTGAAFDQYYLGRPKIDRIVIHWAGDTQVAAASILAGAIDVILPGAAIFPGPMKEIERQWGKGKGRISLFPNDVAILWLNFRVEGHRWDPAQAGWQRDARFRQAMLYSINREPLAADLQESFTPVVYYPAFLEF